jgi:hypothetical protein
MNKRRIAALAVAGTVASSAGAVAVGGALVGASPAFAGGSSSGTSSSGASSSGTVLHDNAVYVKGTSTDVKPAGDSIGDSAVDLFSLRTSDGKPAGDLTNICTLFRPGAHPLAQCSGAVTLHDGVLTLAGSTTGSDVTTYAVTGGTGRFAGAGGVFRVDGAGHVTITLSGAR